MRKETVKESHAPNFRQTHTDVKFPVAFKNVPSVAVSLSGVDAHHEQNARVGVAAAAVTPSGFTINVGTWADTTIHSATVTWTAFDEIRLLDTFEEQKENIATLQLAVESLQLAQQAPARTKPVPEKAVA